MKKFDWKTIILIVIVALSFVLRTYKINVVPPSLSWDEVSIGYNAWSILKTGRDEHGRFLPLDTFIAYGDYKPPVPIYITVPFVALLGLSEEAVRLPVAIIGTCTIILVYLLVKQLFSNHKHKEILGLLSAFVICLSPWHINLSRAGFEATIGLFWVVLSANLFLSTRYNKKLFYIAFLPLVLAIYTFNSARYFAPFFGVSILFFLKDSVLKAKKQVLVGMIISGICMLPILPHLLSPEARLRFKEVNIFSDVEIVKLANERIQTAGNTWWANIIHNRRVYYLRAFAKHYFDHFEPRFLFIQGDGNPKFSIQDVGQLYFIESPLLAIGLLVLISEYPGLGIFLLMWLGFAIVPAATARETPHALRILNTLPTWHIFIAYGIYSIFSFFKIRMFKIMALMVIGIGYLFCSVYYLHTYYRHYPYQYSGEWQFGYRDAFKYAEKVKDQYQQIVVTDYIGRPYEYALFYGKYEPSEFWKTKKDKFDDAGFYNVYGFGSYQFVRKNPEIFEPNKLYILSPESKPPGATEVFHVNLLNGTPALIGFHI